MAYPPVTTRFFLRVLQVLAAADAVVSNHNEGGIAEAIERFIL